MVNVDTRFSLGTIKGHSDEQEIAVRSTRIEDNIRNALKRWNCVEDEGENHIGLKYLKGKEQVSVTTSWNMNDGWHSSVDVDFNIKGRLEKESLVKIQESLNRSGEHFILKFTEEKVNTTNLLVSEKIADKKHISLRPKRRQKEKNIEKMGHLRNTNGVDSSYLADERE